MKKAAAFFYILFLQPPALLTWAGFIILFYVAFRLLGWREMTIVLTGTFPPELPPSEAISRATIFMVSYFAAVLLAPIMILGTAFSLLADYLKSKISGSSSIRHRRKIF